MILSLLFFKEISKNCTRSHGLDVCLRVLKESNKSRFDSYSVRKSALIISHITFRDCRVQSFPTTFLEIAVCLTKTPYEDYKTIANANASVLIFTDYGRRAPSAAAGVTKKMSTSRPGRRSGRSRKSPRIPSPRGYKGIRLVTRDDVVRQRHKFGSAFLSYFSWESKIAFLFKLSRILCPSQKNV